MDITSTRASEHMRRPHGEETGAKAKYEKEGYQKMINKLAVTDLPGAHWSEKTVARIFHIFQINSF